MKKVLGLLLILFVLVIIALGLGAYNIAATDKHWDVTEKIIAQVRDSSVTARAKDFFHFFDLIE